MLLFNNMNFKKNTLNQFKEKRRHLIQNLRKKGIADENVLKAIDLLPREIFLSPSLISQAYEDNALPIDCNQTISQPYTVAFMTEKLEVKEGDKILEIGTGSGYQSCLLYLMGARVFTIERILTLLEKAKE
jgi:protein-L-isoaspartate(D-aspartate) O-methyltransferase